MLSCIIPFIMFVGFPWLFVYICYKDSKKEEFIWKKCCKLVEHRVVDYKITRVDDDDDFTRMEHKIVLKYLTDKGWKTTEVSKMYPEDYVYQDILLLKNIKVYTSKDYYYHIVEPFAYKSKSSNSSSIVAVIGFALMFTFFFFSMIFDK